MRLWFFSHMSHALPSCHTRPVLTHICLMAQPVSPRWHTRPCVVPTWRHLILCHFLYMFSSAPHIYVSLEFFSRLQGVQFVFDCCMGLRPYDGEGCILADDMGLGHIYTHFPHLSHAILPISQRRFSFFSIAGKTLQSITILWTLMCQVRISFLSHATADFGQIVSLERAWG